MTKRWHLTFNDHSQIIQGYHVNDRDVYCNIKAAVLNKGLEDWQPNYADIMLLDKSYRQDNPIVAMLMPAFLCEHHERLRNRLGKIE